MKLESFTSIVGSFIKDSIFSGKRVLMKSCDIDKSFIIALKNSSCLERMPTTLSPYYHTLKDIIYYALENRKGWDGVSLDYCCDYGLCWCCE
jgi:hypothetical protein